MDRREKNWKNFCANHLRDWHGIWQGTSITMTPDLNVSSPVPTPLQWPVEGNKTFFFPDDISLSCPPDVSIGTEFTLIANWRVTPIYLQQLTVKYNQSGHFSSLKLDLCHL